LTAPQIERRRPFLKLIDDSSSFPPSHGPSCARRVGAVGRTRARSGVPSRSLRHDTDPWRIWELTGGPGQIFSVHCVRRISTSAIGIVSGRLKVFVRLLILEPGVMTRRRQTIARLMAIIILIALGLTAFKHALRRPSHPAILSGITQATGRESGSGINSTRLDRDDLVSGADRRAPLRFSGPVPRAAGGRGYPKSGP
jgi:hypothetical protein